MENSAALNELSNGILINKFQGQLDEAENSGVQISLTGNYLFAPFFNNNGNLISTSPAQDAIGYDAGITNGGLYSAQINFSKNIFNGNLLTVLKNKNFLTSQNSVYSIELEKHNIIKSVTDSYISCLQNYQLFEAYNESNINLTEQLNISSSLLQKGFIKAQDYLLLKIEIKNQEINKEQTWLNFRSGLSQLNSLCGIRDTSSIIPYNLNLSYNGVISNSGYLKKYDIDSSLINSQQELFETKYNPQVNLFFNTGLNAIEINNMQRKFGISAGVNFSFPLYDGNQKTITSQQNEISINSIRQNKKYFTNNLFIQLHNSIEKINSLKEISNNLRSQIDDYKKIISLSENQLMQGSLSMIEYLTLQKNYTEMKKNMIISESDLQTEINLYNYWNW
jgi:outer membrane protein TolC